MLNALVQMKEKIFYRLFKSIKLKRKLHKRTKVINLNEVAKMMKVKRFDKKALRYVVKI